jgi:hypothetical protein
MKRSLSILDKCVCKAQEAPRLAVLLEFAELNGRNGSIKGGQTLESSCEPSGERPGSSSDEGWDAF